MPPTAMEINEPISARTIPRSKSLAAQILMHAACPILYSETGKQLSNGQLRRHPRFATTWNKFFSNEMGQLFQGVGTGSNVSGQRIKVTDTFFVINVKDIPPTRIKEVCYTSVVCEVRPGKQDPSRTCIPFFGTNVCYMGDMETNTASLKLFKLMLNIVLSRKGAKFSCFYIDFFYLSTPLERPEYVKIQMSKNTSGVH